MSDDQCQSGPPPPSFVSPPTFQTISYFTRPSFLPFGDPPDCGSMSLSSDEILRASRRHPPSLLSSNMNEHCRTHVCIRWHTLIGREGLTYQARAGSFRPKSVRAAGFIGRLTAHDGHVGEIFFHQRVE